MGNDNIDKFLPLTESTYYAMLTLLEPEHGYAIMQKVTEISRGNVTLGPGTLYGILSMLEKEGLIIKVKEEDRRKSYILTTKGKQLLLKQIQRLEIMTQNGVSVRNRL